MYFIECLLLAVTGGISLWYVRGVTNMRYGKYRLFAEVELLGKNPYNGDAYVFLSKDRRTLKIIRFKNHKRLLYDITYEKGYRFLQPVCEGGSIVYELDFKYLVALLECPIVKRISI